jgi:hypothetical protein
MPWDLLTGWLVDKPKAEYAAQAAIAQAQAQAIETAAIAKSKTIKVAMIAGAGVLGLVLIAAIMKPPHRAAVAGYRGTKRSRR